MDCRRNGTKTQMPPATFATSETSGVSAASQAFATAAPSRMLALEQRPARAEYWRPHSNLALLAAASACMPSAVVERPGR